SVDHETANPLISVLMPTFNQAAFLRRALTSLFAQTHANWELLVVNYGSSDDTPRVLAEYSADPRIRSWRLEETAGWLPSSPTSGCVAIKGARSLARYRSWRYSL